MQIDEEILLLFEGAMGFHCNRKKEEKMPYICFKKNIELNLNSFSVRRRRISGFDLPAGRNSHFGPTVPPHRTRTATSTIVRPLFNHRSTIV